MRVIIFVISVIVGLAGMGLLIGAFIASSWDFTTWHPGGKSFLAVIWFILSLGFTLICWDRCWNLQQFLRSPRRPCKKCSAANDELAEWRKSKVSNITTL